MEQNALQSLIELIEERAEYYKKNGASPEEISALAELAHAAFQYVL